VIAVLVPTLGAVGWVGIHGMQGERNTIDDLYAEHLTTVSDAASLTTALQDADLDSIELLRATSPSGRGQIMSNLVTEVLPEVNSSIALVGTESANDPLEKPRAAAIEANWSKFQEFVASGALASAKSAAPESEAEIQATAIFGPATANAKAIIGTETLEAKQSYAQAIASYRSSMRWMLITMILALLAVTLVVGWLVRSVLRRTLEYAAFAADVTRGDYSKHLEPDGRDELADLGRALDDLARGRQAADLYDHRQSEFTDTLQVAETEQETYELVKRHLERSVNTSSVTVLNRNNSADRLQAMTVLAEGSALEDGLQAAKPRSCIAIRTARPHYSSKLEDPLLACPVCSQCPDRTSCTPLLVSGEVIGSILVDHRHPLAEVEERTIREASVQAAPVLGNLRNLAIAEMRAATDSLTGLPNRRAIEDTTKRMVAQSSSSGSPLTALMCDLDHFKSINDRFGHDRGDEVLAAVGTVLADTVRATDFAGRYGGEEFLVLLAATDQNAGLLIAERIRVGVAAIRVPAVDQRITISVGLAIAPEHAIDAETLVRAADRALYAAKNGGRDRVETCLPRAASPVDPERHDEPGVPVVATNGSVDMATTV
jgi:diguanylate cyclase (GGDEF)-like protein